MKKRIENAVKSMGLENEVVIRLVDMEKIAEMADCSLLAVMKYLRAR